LGQGLLLEAAFFLEATVFPYYIFESTTFTFDFWLYAFQNV
jgi:hypothetical protein